MVTDADLHVDPAAIGLVEGLLGLTFAQALDRAADAEGSRTALVDDGRRWTWAELRRDARRFAGGLADAGIGRGDVVGLHLPNSAEYVIAHYGISLLGAVTLPLHMPFSAWELTTLLGRSDAVAAVTCAEFRGRRPGDTIDQLRAELPALRHVIVTGGDAGDGRRRFEELLDHRFDRWDGGTDVRAGDVLAALASSGTTSTRLKICLHTHDALLSNAALIAEGYGLDSGSRVLSASPFTHAMGLEAMHLMLILAGCTVVIDGWDAARFLELCGDEQVTTAFAVPTQLKDLIDHVAAGDVARDRLALRQVSTGGAKVPASMVRWLTDTLGVQVFVQWGMSEVGGGCHTRPHRDDADAIANTIGTPVAGAEARIVDADGVDVIDGEEGELWFRSPFMFRGYLRDRDMTGSVLTPDGWIRTGDRAAFDPQRRIVFRGRTAETINRGGMKVSGVEIAELVAELPTVRRAAVVPVPHERLGQQACAVVEPIAGATVTLDEILLHLDERGVARFKWPEHLHVVDEMPLTPSGKPSLGVLIQRVQSCGTSPATSKRAAKV